MATVTHMVGITAVGVATVAGVVAAVVDATAGTAKLAGSKLALGRDETDDVVRRFA